MKPRERVLAAIAHNQPDRVPVDFGAMRSMWFCGESLGRAVKFISVILSI